MGGLDEGLLGEDLVWKRERGFKGESVLGEEGEYI